MVTGQCMQVLLDKMIYDPDWDKVSTPYDPLQLLILIKNIVLVEDTVNNVDVDDGHTYCHADTHTWSDIVSRGMIRGRNMQP